MDLNSKSEEGWSLLVEGLRDERALKKLGYEGNLVTVSSLRRNPTSLGVTKGVMILTDLDREGALLASKFVRSLSHEGVRTSLSERRRLKAASQGVFLHIENLGRFARPEAKWWEPPPVGPEPKQGRIYREGLRRFRRPSAG